jgi:hypothetical protein
MVKSEHPTIQEYNFLELAYARFEKIWQIYTKGDFYAQSAEYRFFCLKDAFSIYSEVITYQPLRDYLCGLEIAKNNHWNILNVDLPKVVRNIILHFPFFTKWEDVYINKALATWNNLNSTIDKFFEKHKGAESIIINAETEMDPSYEIRIHFPAQYNYITNIYLKDIINEETGIDLFLTLMKTAMFSQLESLKKSQHHKPI